VIVESGAGSIVLPDVWGEKGRAAVHVIAPPLSMNHEPGTASYELPGYVALGSLCVYRDTRIRYG
jgi:hypothetical protein